ncbi:MULTISPECIES: type VI secretion system tube protein Hcp [Pseudomonas]|uniref:Hcp family type VI secretion system effector n=1 Tax=Pseudomonas TaxID=286 RepID=UPI0015966010|nr:MULTISPECIES: type VI secretion system tube protein Hcp [Pseudomonas]
MAFDAYLKIDGIPGEALDDKHKDWIEVLGYQYGATQATSATASSSGGASSERVNLSDFTIRKYVDKASAKAFEACCKGQHIKEVVLNVNRAGGDKVTYLTITLEEVVISSVNFLGNLPIDGEAKAESDLPMEEIKFNFSRIKTTYTQQKRSDGAGGGKVTGGWDRSLNKVYA